MFTKDRRTLQVVLQDKVFVRGPVDWSLWTVFPHSVFFLLALLSFQVHHTFDPAEHLHSCSGVEVNPDGHPLLLRTFSPGYVCTSLLEAHPRRVVHSLSYHLD